MPRRKRVIKKRIYEDPRYNDYEIEKFINKLMWDGKKDLAYRIFYDMMDQIKEKMNQDPLPVFKKALNNVKPKLEVRPRRIGGATYQIPIEVSPHRSLSLAIRWIVETARSKKGKSIVDRLVEEILEAYKGEGASIKKRDETHKMAEANRAFAHYRW